jgi:hypothetical protein
MAASLFGGLFNSLIYHDYDPYLDCKGTETLLCILSQDFTLPHPPRWIRCRAVFTGSSRGFFNKMYIT